MKEQFPVYSSSLRLSQKIDCIFGGIFSILLASFPLWVSIKYLLSANSTSISLAGLLLFVFITVVLISLSVLCFAVVIRSRLKMDADGVVYQSVFDRVVLSWEDVKGFAFAPNSLHLVYNPSRLPPRPEWFRKSMNMQPIIPIFMFTNEWSRKNQAFGPIMSVIFRYAPHLFEEVHAKESSHENTANR